MISPSFKNLRLIDWLIVPLIFLVIIISAHYGLFMGHTFFVEPDPVLTFSYDTKDKNFSGWRPDLGAGLTFFFGDPGFFHTWSLSRLWQKLFSDSVWAYNIFILMLLWIACVVMYFILLKTVPRLNRVLMVALASLIAINSLRHEFFFQKHWIMLPISSGLVSIILFDFFKSPSPRHFFLYTLTLSASIFLGSSRILASLLFFVAVFFGLFAYYHGLHKSFLELCQRFKLFFLLNLGAGITILLLGAWVFYSIFLETFLTGYVRDPNDLTDTFFAPLSLLKLLERFLYFLHAGLFSPDSGVLGLSQNMSIPGWNNVSPVFPLVLVFSLFYKSESFWEFSSKFIVVGVLLLQEFLDWVPGIFWFFPEALNIFGDLKLHPTVQLYEVILIAIFIQRLQVSEPFRKPLEIKFMRSLSIGLSLLYGSLLMLALGAKFAPVMINAFFQEIFQWLARLREIVAEKKEFLSELISGNIQLFHETMGWFHIFYYGLALLFVLSFSKNKFPGWFSRDKGLYFSITLLVVNLFLAWSIYPLNKEPLVWERQNFTEGATPFQIKEYDRIAKVGAAESCLNPKDLIACVRFKYLKGEFGPKRYVMGYRLSPGFDFSGVKSFSQKEVTSLVIKFLEMDGLSIENPFRYFQGFPPYSHYKIYDFTGVKYFVSPYPLPTSKSIKSLYSSFQFYVYENLDAWPYYYFADRIETIKNVEELYHAKKGTAYLWEDSRKSDFFGENPAQEKFIELSRFRFGDMEFRSTSKNEEFLVVSDAWHPFWKAQVDGKEVDVLKANGVFKGIFVSPGDHEIRLFFDNTPYRLGIWISIISWIIFIGAWIAVHRKNTIGF